MNTVTTTPRTSSELFRTLDEIGRWAASDGEPYRVLTNVACLIGNQLDCHACSLYVVEPAGASLVLAATVGLSQDAVGRLRMPFDEGLTGLVAETARPVVVPRDAAAHPRFKYFRTAVEDEFESYLGVPILDRPRLEGVLAVQTIGPRNFADEEILWLGIVGRQIGSLIAELRGRRLFRDARESVPK